MIRLTTEAEWLASERARRGYSVVRVSLEGLAHIAHTTGREQIDADGWRFVVDVDADGFAEVYAAEVA